MDSIKAAFFFLLLAGVLFSTTIQESIINYYLSEKIENVNVTMKYTDTSDMSPAQINVTRTLLAGIYSKYKVDYHTISNLSFYQEGDYALAQYILRSDVSGLENLSYTLDYIALFHRNSNADWLIVFVMPLDDYLDAEAQYGYYDAANAIIGNGSFAAPYTGVSFSGAQMKDLNSDLQQGLSLCTTDDYCKAKGFLGCVNNTCSNNVPIPVVNNTVNSSTNATSNKTNTTINTTINATPKTNTTLNITKNTTNATNTSKPPANVSSNQNKTIQIQIPSELPSSCPFSIGLVLLAALGALAGKKIPGI